MLDKKRQKAVDAYLKYGSQQKAADSLGVSRRTFRDRYNKALSLLNNTPVGFKTTKVSSDGEGRVTSRTHKLAPETTDIKRVGKVIRRSTLYGADGNVTGEWIIRKPEVVSEDQIGSIIESFKSELPRFEPVVKEKSDNQDLTLVNIVDDHVNMKAFASETGEDWNLEKCLNVYTKAFNDLMALTPDTGVGMLMNLGDQFHANDHMAVTPASKHKLDVDIPFADAARYVINLNRYRINEMLKKFDVVKVGGVRGNHDEDAMVLLYEALRIAFENEERVEFDYSSSGQVAISHGKNMIGFDHGDKGKPETLAGNIANDYPELFGASKHRYIHTGHVHNDNEKDTWGAFLWRSHRTLSARDRYIASNKYHSPRTLKSFVYDPEGGEKTIYKVNI